MAVKNLLVDVKNAVLIAQAGIKGTLESLKQVQSQATAPPPARTPTRRKRTSKKVASSRTIKKPKAKQKPRPKKRAVRQPSKAHSRKRPTRAR